MEKKHSEFTPLAYLQQRKEFLEDEEDLWQLRFQAPALALSLSPSPAPSPVEEEEAVG